MSLSTRSNLLMGIVWNRECGRHDFLYISFLPSEFSEDRMVSEPGGVGGLGRGKR